MPSFKSLAFFLKKKNSFLSMFPKKINALENVPSIFPSALLGSLSQKWFCAASNVQQIWQEVCIKRCRLRTESHPPPIRFFWITDKGHLKLCGMLLFSETIIHMCARNGYLGYDDNLCSSMYCVRILHTASNYLLESRDLQHHQLVPP